MPTTEAVAVRPKVRFYEAEEFLQMMLETEGAVDPEQEAAFAVELRKAVSTAVDKREAVGQFILHAEGEAKMRRDRAKALTEQARVLEAAADRVREMVCAYIVGLGPDAKGKLPKLEAHTLTLSARRNPASLVIDGDVPEEYRDVIIRTDPATFRWLQSQYPEVLHSWIWETRKDDVKKALEKGADIPGARLVTDKYSLQVK